VSVSEMVWVVETLEVATNKGGLDLDGDGTPDAVSVTFDFTAVPATVY